jgi:hypothetical protein
MSDEQKISSKETGKKTGEKTPLFRAEAIRHRTRALFGDVVLAAPLSTWLITGLLAVIIAGLIAFGVLGRVQIDGDGLSIWRWILGVKP